MATGILPKRGTSRRTNPVTVTYDGKLTTDEILSADYSDFSIYRTINGGNENHFFYGDNLDI